MKLGRRALLQASLGLTQMGLLAKLGMPSNAFAQTATDGPDKLLTLYLPGGWMSLFAFCGLSAAEVQAVMPPAISENGEPIFFSDAQLANLDGTSGPGAGGAQPLRVPKLWDEARLSVGQPDLRNGTSPHGWAWKQHRLWENTTVVHGVDQMTAAHVAGSVSAMCGVASSEFKSPSMHALAAHYLYDRFPERPLPSVWIGGPQPATMSQLRSESAPLRIPRANDIAFMFSDKRANAWSGLRASDVPGAAKDPVDFDGAAVAGGFKLNPIEDRSLRRFRALKGQTNPATQKVLETLHEELVGVSRVLARDVTTVVQNTNGVEHTPQPFWAPTGGHFAVDLGGFGSDGGGTWASQFDLALKLLKSNLTSSVAVECPGVGSYGFDNGHTQGHRVQFAQVRGTFEVIGRLLGEMKATPGQKAGKSLLDETLVVLISDFSRTWPKSGPTSDHWPANSVVFAGGGLNTNRMIGGYGVDVMNPTAQGFDGVPVGIDDVAGGMLSRRPRSGDVVTTALKILGAPQFTIPGGNGEIMGVRSGT